MLRLIADPKFFNYVLLVLYVAAAVRWAVAKSSADVLYWVGAIILQVTVTFMFKR
jgi:hypothetical protein